MKDNMNPGMEYLYVGKDVVTQIADVIREYQNPRNDGWVQDGYRQQLVAMADMIQEALRPTDFDVEDIDPSKRSWYYDGYGKKRPKGQ
tara:strand:- start:839 stop:1102 length:264 start_codon:yes stop_codon:yes gene_type:complete